MDRRFFSFRGPVPHIKCTDGFVISIQAHPDLHCTYDELDRLTEVEIACKPTPETEALYSEGGFTTPEMKDWACYGDVPVETVKGILRAHGGVAENFEHLPPELQDPALDSNNAVASQWEACLGVPL